MNFDTKDDDTGLLPYEVIQAAMKGDALAVQLVMNRFEGFIESLSLKKIYDDNGGTYYGVDVDVRDRVYAKLMEAILKFEIR